MALGGEMAKLILLQSQSPCIFWTVLPVIGQLCNQLMKTFVVETYWKLIHNRLVTKVYRNLRLLKQTRIPVLLMHACMYLECILHNLTLHEMHACAMHVL